MRTELNKNTPAQRDSKFSKSSGSMGVMESMGWKTKIKSSSAQWHSKFSNGRLSGLFCWPQGQDENTPAQRDSKFSKFRKNHFLHFLHFLHDLHGEEMLSAQWHSKFSKLGICPSSPLRPSSPSKLENTPAQQDSKFSKLVGGCLGVLGKLGWKTKMKNIPVQRNSNISKLKKNQTLHFLHDLHGEEMLSAQRHSIMSKRGSRPLSPLCLFCQLAPRNSPAQRHSKMCKFTKLSIVKCDLNFFPENHILPLCFCGCVV